MAKKKAEYVAPRRKDIKEAVCKLLPHVDAKLIRQLDWWALYTIHQDVAKDGKNAEALACKLVKGYDPEKIKAEQEKIAARKAREEERKIRAREVAASKAEAKRKAAAAKAQGESRKGSGKGQGSRCEGQSQGSEQFQYNQCYKLAGCDYQISKQASNCASIIRLRPTSQETYQG